MQFYHTAYNDMEVLEQNKKEALSMYKELVKLYGEEELKPDEFMTYIHQFAQTFKEVSGIQGGDVFQPPRFYSEHLTSCFISRS